MTTSPNNPTASEKLATEASANEMAARLDLLQPVGKIRAYERLAILAGAADMNRHLGTGEFDVNDLDPAALKALGNFAKDISGNYAVSAEAQDTLEYLDIQAYLETVFAFVSLLGE